MLKRKATSYQNRQFKKPRQTAGAAMYNTFARAGAFSRSAVARRSVPRGMVNRDVKGCDVLLTQALGIVSTTGTNANAVLLNGIQAGTGSFNRVGRKAHLKSLRLKGTVEFVSTPSATGSEGSNFLRMVVVWDQQPSGGTIPTWDTIFGITDQAGTESSTIMSPLRYDNMDRFKVLKDKTIDYQVQPSTPVTTAQITEQVPFDEFVSLGNREVVFASTSNPTTIADISTGGLYVYFRAFNAITSNSASVNAMSVARLRYTD